MAEQTFGEQTPNEPEMTADRTETFSEASRRRFIKAAAVAAAAGLMTQGGAEQAAGQTAPTDQAERKFKISISAIARR